MWLTLYRVRFDPETHTTRPPGDFPAGVRLDYVVTGTYAVRVDGPLLITRTGAGALPQPVTAGTEVTLAPGDSALYPDDTRQQTFGNPGAERAVVLFAGLLADAPPMPPTGIVVDASGEWVLTAQERAALGSGEVRLTLRRVTLAPGAGLAPPGTGTVRLVVAEASGATVIGTVRNTGTEALAFLVLTVAPAGSGEATPIPGTPAALAGSTSAG
jgi:hypothetical protein